MLARLLPVALMLAAAPAPAQPRVGGAPGAGGSRPAVELPPGFSLEPVGGSFDTPLALAFAPDGRVFVAEKGGRVRVVEGRVQQAEPFVDLSDEVMSHWDRGLLGLALDPDFARTGHVYLYYTVDRDGAGDVECSDVFARLTR